jgi:hypothetical protein
MAYFKIKRDRAAVIAGPQNRGLGISHWNDKKVLSPQRAAWSS